MFCSPRETVAKRIENPAKCLTFEQLKYSHFKQLKFKSCQMIKIVIFVLHTQNIILNSLAFTLFIYWIKFPSLYQKLCWQFLCYEDYKL